MINLNFSFLFSFFQYFKFLFSFSFSSSSDSTFLRRPPFRPATLTLTVTSSVFPATLSSRRLSFAPFTRVLLPFVLSCPFRSASQLPCHQFFPLAQTTSLLFHKGYFCFSISLEKKKLCFLGKFVLIFFPPHHFCLFVLFFQTVVTPVTVVTAEPTPEPEPVLQTQPELEADPESLGLTADEKEQEEQEEDGEKDDVATPRSASPSPAPLEEEEVSQEPVKEEKPVEAPEEMKAEKHRPSHFGVVCDICRSEIVGVRYKCGHCQDFDLCEGCESTEHTHPPNHLFIKIKIPLNPTHSPAWYHKHIFLPKVNIPQPVFFTPSNPAFCHMELKPSPAPLPVLTPLPAASSSPSPVLAASKPVVVPAAEPKLETPASVPSVVATPVLITPTVPVSPEVKKPAFVPSVAKTTYDAKFVDDVSIMDGTIIMKSTSFTKIWKMKNTGEVKWPLGTRLAFVGGDPMGKLQSFVVIAALPGQEVDISVTLTAPAEHNRYISHWRLQTQDGQKFGHRIWCDVVVTPQESQATITTSSPALTPTPTLSPEVITPSTASSTPVPSASPIRDEETREFAALDEVRNQSFLHFPDCIATVLKNGSFCLFSAAL